MIKKESRSSVRVKKHKKVRNKIYGTADRPRLAVFRSNMHIYAQIINDDAGNTIASSSTVQKAISSSLEKTNNVEAAKAVGTDIAKKAADAGITEVVFDRGGYIYHGKVKALADAAREEGLKF